MLTYSALLPATREFSFPRNHPHWKGVSQASNLPSRFDFVGRCAFYFFTFGAFAWGRAAAMLAAPMHRHSREDEYSYVLRGRLGALLGDEVVFAEPGELVFKPRNQWHTFWNASDDPASILEIIAPSGFERFFNELADQGGVTNVAPSILGNLCERYGLEMRPDSVPELVERFQLRFPGEPVTPGDNTLVSVEEIPLRTSQNVLQRRKPGTIELLESFQNDRLG